jgi:hypothetical protein
MDTVGISNRELDAFSSAITLSVVDYGVSLSIQCLFLFNLSHIYQWSLVIMPAQSYPKSIPDLTTTPSSPRWNISDTVFGNAHCPGNSPVSSRPPILCH